MLLRVQDILILVDFIFNPVLLGGPLTDACFFATVDVDGNGILNISDVVQVIEFTTGK